MKTHLLWPCLLILCTYTIYAHTHTHTHLFLSLPTLKSGSKEAVKVTMQCYSHGFEEITCCELKSFSSSRMCCFLSFTAGFTCIPPRYMTKEGSPFTSSWDTAGLNTHKSHPHKHKVGHRAHSIKITEIGVRRALDWVAVKAGRGP